MVYLGEILAGVIVKGSQERIVDCGGDLHEGGGGGGGGGVILVSWLESFCGAAVVCSGWGSCSGG